MYDGAGETIYISSYLVVVFELVIPGFTSSDDSPSLKIRPKIK